MSPHRSSTLARAASASPALHGTTAGLPGSTVADAGSPGSTQDTAPPPLADLPGTARTRAVPRPAADATTPWDLPLRIFHLGLLLSVGTALVTAWIGGNAMVWHGRAGAVVAGLLGFRLVWGLLGSPTSRFRQFLPSPRSLSDYLRGRWHGVGHNPLGALAVFAILAVLGGQVLTGLFSNDEIAFTGPYAAAVPETLSLRLTGWHQGLAWGVYSLVGLHLVAIALHEGLKRHRLVRPMFRWQARPEQGDGTSGTRSPPPTRGLTLAFALALAVGAMATLASSPGPAEAPAAATPSTPATSASGTTAPAW